MFSRSLFVFAGVLVASAMLAVSAAMATDEPVPPSQGTQAAPTACVDHVKPQSQVKGGLQRSFHNGRIRGIAIDGGCGANGAGKLKAVQVAVERKVGKRCEHLTSGGKLSKAGKCTHVWLRAKGTKAWSFRLPRHLPRGTYAVSTRAVDAAGNIEKK
jgi:hypothetical protein